MGSICRLGVTTVLLTCLLAVGCSGGQRQDGHLGGEETAGLVDAVNNAADSGDKEGTMRMKELVAILKTSAGHENDGECHYHEA